MKTEEELIDEWLKTNKPKVFHDCLPKPSKFTGIPYKTNVLTPIVIDKETKRREYKYLNKIYLSGTLDESTRNYGS